MMPSSGLRDGEDASAHVPEANMEERASLGSEEHGRPVADETRNKSSAEWNRGSMMSKLKQSAASFSQSASARFMVKAKPSFLQKWENAAPERPQAPQMDQVVWRDVLVKLQKEKSKHIAIEEERYVNPSLFCLKNTSRFRNAFINLEQWGPLNHFILVAIFVNCLFLTFEDPVCKCAEGRGQDFCTEYEFFKRILYVGARWQKAGPLEFWHTQALDLSIDCTWQESTEEVLWTGEIVFTIIFLVEMMIKIIARGFILHKHAYLWDPLNWLDFIVVVSGTVSVTMDMMSLPKSSFAQFLRALRVLRPLRTMTRIRGMKPLIRTLIKAIKQLAGVVLLLIFGFILFGIFGLDMMKKGLRGRCYFDPANNEFPEPIYSRLISQQTPFLVEAMSGTICAPSDWVRSEGNILGGMGCDNMVIDGVEYNVVCSRKKWCQHQISDTDHAKYGNWCRYDYNENPFDFGAGWFSYDNFLGAILCMWQTLTNEGWVDLMYSFGDGVSVWGSRIFHLCWVVVGSMMIIQLVLGFLSDEYSQAQDDEEHAKEREALDLNAILMEWDRTQDTEPASLASSFKSFIRRRPSNDREHSENALGRVIRPGSIQTKGVSQTILELWSKLRERMSVLVNSSYFQQFITFAIIVNTLTMIVFTWHNQIYFEGQLCQRRCALDPHLPVSAISDCSAPGGLFNRTFESDGHRGRERPTQDKFCFLKNDNSHEFPPWSKFKGANCSQYQTLSECNEPRKGAPGMGCWWVDGSCQLGLYSSTDFALAASLMVDNKADTDAKRLASSVTLSLRHFCGEDTMEFENFCPGIPDSLTTVANIINDVLTWIFILECVFKLLGLGPQQYFSDTFSRVDFLIVVSSVFEMLQLVQVDVSIFRTLRLTRLIKLMRSMKELQKILRALITALSAMYSVLIVLFIFIFMMSALMMTMFANNFRFVKGDWPRSNFDSFFMSERGHGAFTTIFQMLTTENWNTIMYNCIRNTESPGDSWIDAMNALPSIFIVLVGNYVFINLFISILLQGFELDSEHEEVEESLNKSSKVIMFVRKLTSRFSAKVLPEDVLKPGQGSDCQDQSSGLCSVDTFQEQGAEGKEGKLGKNSSSSLAKRQGYLGKEVKYADVRSFFIFAPSNPARIFASSICQHPVFDSIILLCILITTILLLFERPEWGVIQSGCPRPPQHLDCSGLHPGHEVLNCEAESSHPDFGKVWEPCDASEPTLRPPCCSDLLAYDAFSVMDKFFSLVFLIEMILKMLTDGLILHEHSYLRNSWNILDCVVSILGMLSAFGESNSFKSAKVLRVVRALRPLRVVRRHPNLRVAVLGLISSVPAIISVMPLLSFWYAMWAMLGVSIFKGNMYSCYNPNDQSYLGVAYSQGGPQWEASMTLSGPDAVPTIIECVSSGQGDTVWKSKPYSFDNFPTGFLTLWEMSTTEGWLDVMAALTDSAGGYPGVTPIPNLNPFWPTLYCLTHIFFGSFVFMNVIVSKVINNYTKVKIENNGSPIFITQEQKEWKSTEMIITSLKPRVRKEGPKSPLRRAMFDLIAHPKFDAFITACILLNIISMMVNSLEFEKIECFLGALFWVNLSFTLIFFSEMIIKMIGLGPRWYFIDAWNRLDFVVVLFSLIILGISIDSGEYKCEQYEDSGVGYLRVFRALRILRVLRLIRRIKDLKHMIRLFYISLPSVVNFGALTILVLSIFAVLGMWLFYNVNLHQDDGEFMDENVNYANFDTAFFSLFRQTTGEAWNGIMYYCSETDPYLACALTNSGYLNEGCAYPSKLVGIIYHIVWNIFGCYAMMQLFTAVIIDNLMDIKASDSHSMDKGKLDEFVEVWTKFDPEASEELSVELLPALVSQLSPPLGLKSKVVTKSLLMNVIKDLRIPVRTYPVRDREGEREVRVVSYQDTFLACVKRTIMARQQEEGADGDGNQDQLDETDDPQVVQGDLASNKRTTDASGSDVQSDSSVAKRDGLETSFDAAEEFAARAVQKAFRDWREARIQLIKGLAWKSTLITND